MSIELNQIDKDLLDDLVTCIGRIAAEMFNDPKTQEEFKQWKEKKVN